VVVDWQRKTTSVVWYVLRIKEVTSFSLEKEVYLYLIEAVE